MKNAVVQTPIQRVLALSNLLTCSTTVLPVFVRFQKVDQYLTVPVMHVTVNEDTVEVYTTEESHSISLETLVDIVVFRDASGKAVFLTEFPTGGDLAAEERTMIELWDLIEKRSLGVVKHHNVDDSANSQMNIDLENDQEFNQGNEITKHRIAA